VGFARRLFKRVIKEGEGGEYMDWLPMKVQEPFRRCEAICGWIRRGWREEWGGGSIHKVKQQVF
jgi:hypothetical protein